MADVYNTSVSHADFIPDITIERALLAFDDHTSNGFLAVAANVSRFLPNGGDTIIVPVQPRVQLTTNTEATVDEYTQWSASQKTLSVNTDNSVVVLITDRAQALVNQDLFDNFVEQVAADAAQNIDAALATLYSSAGVTVTGSTGSNIAEADIRTAKLRLDEAKCPRAGRFLVVNPQQMDALSAISRFTEVDKVGSGEAIREGIVGRIHGFDVFVSNNVVETTDGFAHCVAGVRSANPLISSMQVAYGHFRQPVSNVVYRDIEAIGLRLKFDNDNKAGGESLRGEQLYGTASWRSEWLVDIKVAD